MTAGANQNWPSSDIAYPWLVEVDIRIQGKKVCRHSMTDKEEEGEGVGEEESQFRRKTHAATR